MVALFSQSSCAHWMFATVPHQQAQLLCRLSPLLMIIALSCPKVPLFYPALLILCMFPSRHKNKRKWHDSLKIDIKAQKWAPFISSPCTTPESFQYQHSLLQKQLFSLSSIRTRCNFLTTIKLFRYRDLNFILRFLIHVSLLFCPHLYIENNFSY